MRFFAPILAAFVALASAQNAFNVPASGYSVTAGSSTTFSWSPTTSGTVSLVLRYGVSSDLNDGTLIVSGLPNSGSYTWSVPSSTVAGSDYTIEIIDDENPNITNYTPTFVINSTVTVATTTAIYTSGAGATSKLPSSTAIGSSASASLSNASAASATSSALAAASSVRSSLQGVATSASKAASSVAASMAASATTKASAVASATGGAMLIQAPVAGMLAVGAWVAYVL